MISAPMYDSQLASRNRNFCMCRVPSTAIANSSWERVLAHWTAFLAQRHGIVPSRGRHPASFERRDVYVFQTRKL